MVCDSRAAAAAGGRGPSTFHAPPNGRAAGRPWRWARCPCLQPQPHPPLPPLLPPASPEAVPGPEQAEERCRLHVPLRQLVGPLLLVLGLQGCSRRGLSGGSKGSKGPSARLIARAGQPGGGPLAPPGSEKRAWASIFAVWMSWGGQQSRKAATEPDGWRDHGQPVLQPASL